MAASVSHPNPARLAAEQRLSALRGKLRDLYAARKVRMKAFVAECRAERKALSEGVQAMKKRSLDHLREQVVAARGAANLVRLTRLAEIRQTFGADVRGARAAIAVEKQHQAELARITRDEAERRREIQHAHDHAVMAGEVRSALLGKLGPFLEREGRAIVHVPGQPRGVALLHHAEQHAHKAHATVDPQGARKVEEVERAVAHAENHVRSVGGNPYVPPARPLPPKTDERVIAPTAGKAAAKAPGQVVGQKPRQKGQLPRGGGGMSLDGVLRERDELAAARAKRAASHVAGSVEPSRLGLPSTPAANANAHPATNDARPSASPRGASRERRNDSDVKAPELKDTADIAKRIRADIQEAVRSKQLPKATYAVRTSKYSMGSSIDVVASKLPFPVLNPDAFRFDPHYREVSLDRGKFKSQYTPAAEEVLAKLNALVDAYHWDRSDSASDYYNERFARDVKLESTAEWQGIKALKSGGEGPKGIQPPRAKTRATPAKRSGRLSAPKAKRVAASPPAPTSRPPASVVGGGDRAPTSPTPKKSGTRRKRGRPAAPKGQQSLDTDSPLFANAPRFQAAPAPRRAPNAYEAKKAARVERLKARSEKLHAEAEGAFARQRRIGDKIPFGQPILVGHHSEKRHRRDLGKIDALMGKGVALSKKAEALSRRAKAVEKSTAISSDDPEAALKLRAKLEALGKSRQQMVAANAAIRKGGEGVVSRLVALGFRANQATMLLEKDKMGHVGFPAYKLQNTAAEERRVRERLAQLEARAAAPTHPDETIGAAVVSEADNRVRITFPSKPPEALRGALKSAGFRWAPSSNAWQRFASRGAWSDARRILGGHVAPASATALPTPKA